MKNSSYAAFLMLSLMGLVVEVFALLPLIMLPIIFCVYLGLIIILCLGADPYFEKKYNKFRWYARRNLCWASAQHVARQYILQ